MTSIPQDTASPASAAPAPDRMHSGIAAPESAADRFMRRRLRVSGTDKKAIVGAHRAFRTSIVISGIRCLITYLLVPILIPILSFAGIIAAPLGVALCLVAVINGVASVRRFWLADHRAKWMYTAFMIVVFIVLAIALTADVTRLVSTS